MCRTHIILLQCLFITTGKIQPSLQLGFPKNSHSTTEIIHIFFRAFPEHRWTKWATNFQVGHSALLHLCPLLQPLSRAWPPTGRECISLLTATCKQDRNKPKNSAGVCKVSKASSHEPPANTLDCYSDFLHRRAWLWCRPVVCKPGFFHYHLLQPQHPVEGEGFAASWVNSSLFIINHTSLFFPHTDTKENPHSSFIGQTGSSRVWLTRICKRSHLLSNLDYTICLGRGE